MNNLEKLTGRDLVKEFGLTQMESLRDHLLQETPHYREISIYLFEEYLNLLRIYSETNFRIGKKQKYPEIIFYVILLKQYELAGAAIRSFVSADYIVCATLTRAIFENNLFCLYLSHFPTYSADFVEFSEICCNPDIDWSEHSISKKRIEKLKNNLG